MLVSKMDSMVGENEARLPAQPIPNPKAHCGAISSVDAVTTEFHFRTVGLVLQTLSLEEDTLVRHNINTSSICGMIKYI